MLFYLFRALIYVLNALVLHILVLIIIIFSMCFNNYICITNLIIGILM